MKATTAQMPATLAQKAIALLMALVLCMGLTPHAAWAAETGETGGSSAPQAVEQPTVTLIIVNGFGYSGPNVLANKAYSFTEGQTLADLFAAAKAAGDIEDYEFSNPYGSGEYLASVTMPDGTVVSDSTGKTSIGPTSRTAPMQLTMRARPATSWPPATLSSLRSPTSWSTARPLPTSGLS